MNATEVFIEFICGRVCIFNYVAIFVLNVVCGRVIEFMASLKKSCFENQGFHFISPNFIVIHIFFIVKFVSSFDGNKNFLIHPARLLTLFDQFLFEWSIPCQKSFAKAVLKA